MKQKHVVVWMWKPEQKQNKITKFDNKSSAPRDDLSAAGTNDR